MPSQPRRFGSWPSPISAELVAGKTLRFGDVQAIDGFLYWSEQRPMEQGRAALMRARPGDEPTELLPAPWSAHSRVHEYGGGAFCVTGSCLYFVNAEDQDLYRLDLANDGTGTPKRLSETPDWRYADMVVDRGRNRLIAIGEHHSTTTTHPENSIVAIDLETGMISQIIKGDDFYASPRLSHDGDQLAFLSWNLPHMPWEAAKLQTAHFAKNGKVIGAQVVQESESSASFQPEWDEYGGLWFINDASGFGQLCCTFNGETITFELPGAECGEPQWVFGMKTYGFFEDWLIAVRTLKNGEAGLTLIDAQSHARLTLALDFCAFEKIVTQPGLIGGILSLSDSPAAIAAVLPDDKDDEITVAILRQSADPDLPAQAFSVAQKHRFENEAGQSVHGFYYPPTNTRHEGPPGERPPVILTAHGGPTGYSDCGLALKTQYWTSRGFGVFDVNYSGSWGFGRAYRQRLDGAWGVRDVKDMEAGARHLIAQKLADPAALLISGSSAGGYSVLMTLASSDMFAAGASYYGIGDLARLLESTHKFEAGYLDRLLGLETDNRQDILRQRSPLHLADRISAPVIFFQGGKDKVVPKDQADEMTKALKARNIKCRLELFPDEGHGFRRSDSIKTALEMEYDFYAEVLGL